MVKIVWTENSIQDLNDIGEFIEKDSLKYAERTVEKLFYSVDILIQNPKAGKMVPEFEIESLRELIRGNYRIIYQLIDDSKIEILTVHRSSRLLGNTYNFEDLNSD